MKVTDTVWEKNNIGLRSCEVFFSRNDKIESYNASDIERDYQYSVVKVPVGNLKLVHDLESIGYRYLENQFQISFEIGQATDLKRAWSRDISGFSLFRVHETSDFMIISGEISRGLFKDDRFTLDPLWNEVVSARRYVNWINDLFYRQGALFYILREDDKNLGFFSLQPLEKDWCGCPIAGIFNNVKNNGYFFVLTLLWFEESRKLGFKKLRTSISSNNKSIHSFLCRYFPFRVDETLIVMRKLIK